jgi:uncharacterized membrane protein
MSLHSLAETYIPRVTIPQTITFLLGIMIGAFLSPYAVTLNWPTGEMRERGQAIQLLFGAIVAALSGTGVALAESNANISSVVGVAIAAALLPPTVNCGICFSYVLIGQYFVVSSTDLTTRALVVQLLTNMLTSLYY